MGSTLLKPCSEKQWEGCGHELQQPHKASQFRGASHQTHIQLWGLNTGNPNVLLGLQLWASEFGKRRSENVEEPRGRSRDDGQASPRGEYVEDSEQSPRQ